MFRYTPSPVDDAPVKSDDDEVADWFSTETDPAIAQAVAKAEAEARAPVPGSLDGPREFPSLTPQAAPATQPHPEQ